jgi:hypothetical protein
MGVLSQNPFVSGWPKKVLIDSLDVLSIIYLAASRTDGWLPCDKRAQKSGLSAFSTMK